LLDAIGRAFQSTGRSLVVIQLGGGNDGLNMVIPHGMATYYQKRPVIGIPAANVIQLNTVMGIHPDLQPLRSLYDNGKLAIVQGVGYANPNRSHFRATDIWLSATDSNVTLGTGWMGRDLLYRNPNYPGTLTPSPLALQIGGSPSLGFNSANGPMGVTITDPNQFYQLIAGTVGFIEDPPPNTPAGAELLFLRTIEQEAIQFATVIKQSADRVTNQTTYPTSSLATQLAIVARLIAGGLNTPIYMVQLGGFDTHSGQLNRQQSLFQDLASSIAAFQTDLQLLNVADMVIGMTFSEFGRRIAENGSQGTDHGTSSPQFLFGSRVMGGFHGPNPDFTRLDATGDFIYDIDFRQLYASILGSWFGADETELQSVLLRHFDPLPIINGAAAVGERQIVTRFRLQQNYPNPFNPSTTITYDVPEETYVTLSVYNELGQQVKELYSGVRSRGSYKITFDASGLASGTYIYRINAGSYVETRKMILMR
jgi:uncharacterized protein (DUF1501 family)